MTAYAATLTPEQKQNEKAIRARMAQVAAPADKALGEAGLAADPGWLASDHGQNNEPKTATVYLKQEPAANAPMSRLCCAVTVKLDLRREQC